MVCYANSNVHIIKRDVEGIKREINLLDHKFDHRLTKHFNDLLARLDKRLDDIEIAVLEPYSETALKMREKHGLTVKKTASVALSAAPEKGK